MTIGYRIVEVPDPSQGSAIPVHLLAVTATPAEAREERFGSYVLTVARDAPLAAGPLVVVSHGTGGTPWLYRDLARHLALTGFTVALLEHPGNRLGDDALAGTPALLSHRPRHITRVLDALGAERAAVVGHSLGGYTALAAAGGQPHALPHETPDGRAHPVAVLRDPRIVAIVLLAPALPWFMAPGSLAAVTAPVLARFGERDDLCRMGIGILEREVPAARLDLAVVPAAGHFSFTAPFPPERVRPGFAPSQDPPGFDRAGYQPTLHADVERFLRATLAAGDAATSPR